MLKPRNRDRNVERSSTAHRTKIFLAARVHDTNHINERLPQDDDHWMLPKRQVSAYRSPACPGMSLPQETRSQMNLIDGSR